MLGYSVIPISSRRALIETITDAVSIHAFKKVSGTDSLSVAFKMVCKCWYSWHQDTILCRPNLWSWISFELQGVYRSWGPRWDWFFQGTKKFYRKLCSIFTVLLYNATKRSVGSRVTECVFARSRSTLTQHSITQHNTTQPQWKHHDPPQWSRGPHRLWIYALSVSRVNQFWGVC